MIDGISSDPFSMKTLPPNVATEGSLELIDKIRKQSRQRYAMQKDQLEKLMDAWGKKTFSLQEKVAEKAKYEAFGMNPEEIENLQHPYVIQNETKYTEYEIDGIEPDAIIFDVDNGIHKAVRYTKPKMLENQATLKYKKGDSISTGQGEVKMHLDIYQHQTIMTSNGMPLMIWIGNKEEVRQQIEEICKSAGYTLQQQSFLKFCPNVEILKKLHPEAVEAEEKIIEAEAAKFAATGTGKASKQQQAFAIPAAETAGFSIADIKLGERYEGYVKLSYNYGMFVTVKGVEGLLHKNFIVAPDGVDWKKFFNIGDKIKVKAKEFKEINGEKKVVRSLK